jgi:hypothetical protein
MPLTPDDERYLQRQAGPKAFAPPLGATPCAVDLIGHDTHDLGQRDALDAVFEGSPPAVARAAEGGSQTGEGSRLDEILLAIFDLLFMDATQ